MYKKKLLIKDAAFKILSQKRKPLSIPELTQLIGREIQLRGKTPENTVSNACQRHKKIVRVRKGIYRSI